MDVAVSRMDGDKSRIHDKKFEFKECERSD